MAEKVYLTSDQYVVKCLEDKEKEIAKLNEKYDDLFAKFVVLQAESKKFERLKKWFKLEETSTGNGYQIVVRDEDGHYLNTAAYCWNKEEPDQEFKDLLDLLGLEFPGAKNNGHNRCENCDEFEEELQIMLGEQ